MINDSNMKFKEEQKFDQAWLKFTLLLLFAIVVGFLGYAMVQHLLEGKVSGSGSDSDKTFFIVGVLAILVEVIITWGFFSAKLITEVRSDGLYIRFYPLHLSFHKISMKDIGTFSAVTYSPIREYGGWGIRIRPSGKAYNVKGNRGVRIEYSSGKHILIGSQKPDELYKAIASIVYLGV